MTGSTSRGEKGRRGGLAQERVVRVDKQSALDVESYELGDDGVVPRRF